MVLYFINHNKARVAQNGQIHLIVLVRLLNHAAAHTPEGPAEPVTVCWWAVLSLPGVVAAAASGKTLIFVKRFVMWRQRQWAKGSLNQLWIHL